MLTSDLGDDFTDRLLMPAAGLCRFELRRAVRGFALGTVIVDGLLFKETSSIVNCPIYVRSDPS